MNNPNTIVVTGKDYKNVVQETPINIVSNNVEIWKR